MLYDTFTRCFKANPILTHVSTRCAYIRQKQEVNIMFKKEDGFSLLELSVAVGIAAVVAGVAITATTAFVNGAADSATAYEATADQSITDAEDSSDALGQLDPTRDRGGVTGLNQPAN